MHSKLLCVILLVAIVSVQALPWVPVPRADSNFVTKHHHLMNVTKAHSADEKVIFIGASSMEHWATDGKEVWAQHYAPRHCYNYGIGGDRTENVLWRIEQGELDNVKAKLVVLLVGSNNHADKPEDVAKGMQAIIHAIKGKVAHAKVLLLSILPRGNYNSYVQATNKLIAHEEDKKTVFFLDFTVPFESSTSPGHINATLIMST